MARKHLLKGFKRPRGITFEQSEETTDYGCYIAYPFESGYGTTVGNTLRRILLSSIQGYAISAVRITYFEKDDNAHVVTSEFEAIPHIVEDTPVIINNLKLLRLSLPEDVQEKTFHIEWRGAGNLTGKDFEVDGVTVANKDLIICSVMEEGRLDLEIQVNLGRGYVPSEYNEKYIEHIGTIPLDSMFTPIRKVRYTVENTRVGQRSDYDKLNLEIWTDGTLAPELALAEAAKIAKEHFTIFINFDEDGIEVEEDVDEDDEKIKELLKTPVEELELSVRSSNCLKNANIRTIGDLTSHSEEDIAKTRNFGRKSLLEIKNKLDEWNLTLGMKDFSLIKDAIKQNRLIQKNDESVGDSDQAPVETEGRDRYAT